MFLGIQQKQILWGALQGLRGRTQKILSLLGILAHNRVNIQKEHDWRLLHKVLKCWTNIFARIQLQFTLAMSTNSFKEGEHEDAADA